MATAPLATDARTRYRVSFTDFPVQFEVQAQEILEAIERVLRRGDFILGREVREFEAAFAELAGARHAIGVANGTDALMLAMRAVGVGRGDEVITPPNSWISSTSSIVLIGARPVFADVGPDFNIDPERIEAAITPRTKVLMPVHLTGRCADMDAINALAERHGLVVVEDAAQSAGACYQGRPSGSLGHVGCFSLHPLKNLSGVGDGGVVTTNDDAIAARVRSLSNHGLRTRGVVERWGFNSRLDTLHAAVLFCRLKTLSSVIEARRKNAARYRMMLPPAVMCPDERPGDCEIYHLFMIQCDRRDELMRYLDERGIEAYVHYPTPIHLQPASRDLGYRVGDFPSAEAQARRILSLPVHQGLSAESIDYVVKTITRFYQGEKR
ncbi:MAG: DegT/DnrJ/EryC1/StrS family aminotransferase [Candidatus Omnitrophica bacterium]|nr:DegT/DnrJ/EryC1/StrS family aminotransferase [Candidatus Omnitrophota bacterium]